MSHNQKTTMKSTAPVQRTIQVYESAINGQLLKANGWSYQIAKSVVTPDGHLTFNIVWQSQSIMPNIYIKWTDVYALNWTQTLPNPGVAVTIGGDWQPCPLGGVFDLDSAGYWQTSAVPPEPDYMKVGNIGFQYPGVIGVHIVIGVQNSSGSFDIIYVDPIALSLGDTASYQPQEKLQWWYQAGNNTASMISTADTATYSLDFSTPGPDTGNWYYSTTYIYSSGEWLTSEDPPAAAAYAPPQSIQDLEPFPSKLSSLWPSTWNSLFKLVVQPNKQAKVTAHLTSLLHIRYKDIEVKFVDNLDIKIKLGNPKLAAPHSVDAIGAPNDNIKAEIEACLRLLLDDGDLPAGETWVVQKAQAL